MFLAFIPLAFLIHLLLYLPLAWIANVSTRRIRCCLWSFSNSYSSTLWSCWILDLPFSPLFSNEATVWVCDGCHRKEPRSGSLSFCRLQVWDQGTTGLASSEASLFGLYVTTFVLRLHTVISLCVPVSTFPLIIRILVLLDWCPLRWPYFKLISF